MFLEWFQWSVTEWVLTSALGLFLLIQWWYYMAYFSGIPRFAKRIRSGKIKLSENQPPVTVVITARDQEDFLAKHLPLLLEQDYPEYQVVVVNDASSDDTVDLLKKLALQYPHLYHTFLPPGVQSISTKKMALTVGIKAAKYDYLLFTEANCFPSGNQWIASMMRQFAAETSVVLSYSRYESFKGVFKNLIAYDNLFEGMRYLGMAASKKPYMGVGRNMAYRKDLFFSQKGYAPHLNLYSGEDDLFISDVAKGSNTRVEVSPEAVMQMAARDVKSHWKEARINRIYTSSYYKPLAKFRTGLELFSRYAFYVLVFTILAFGLNNSNVPLLITDGVLFLSRYILQIVVINRTAKTLDDKRFYLSIAFFDVFLPFYILLLHFDEMFYRKKSYTRKVLH
ncbi:MAG TPA: glycosyltransferase [Bacteroidales bacterium]|nr:glycosyltransferase [Bacteroidales bacterium]